MTRDFLRCALATIVLASLPAQALGEGKSPIPNNADPRIRVIPYDEFAVAPLVANLGFQIVIEFDPQERIENVSIGDGSPWQITPNRRATALFVKPVAVGSTNMTVLTTQRRYVFDLKSRERPPNSRDVQTYVLRFSYPEPATVAAPAPPPPSPPPPRPINTAYESKGAKELAPLKIWDDGQFTSLEFGERTELPVLALVDADGKEGLVNFRFEGRTMIFDGVAGRFVLRHGRKKLEITNRSIEQKRPTVSPISRKP